MDSAYGPNEVSSRKRRRSLADSQSALRGEEDKENMTTDVAAMASFKQTSMQAGLLKKSRSKSMGPGGLDALTNDTFNQRKVWSTTAVLEAGAQAESSIKATMSIPFKSILKPTIPLSPLQERPSTHVPSGLGQSGRASVGHANLGDGNATQGGTGLLTDLSTPGHQPHSQVTITGADSLQNPFGSAVANQREDEVEAQAPAATHLTPVSSAEEKKQRERAKKDILERREARRKSLANRRVSFAPEATLHTWNVIEFGQDSTSSSGSTNSNHRASAATNSTNFPSSSPRRQSPARNDETVEVPSTPIQHVKSPTNQTPPARSYAGTQDGRNTRRSSDAASSGGDDLTAQNSFSSPSDASSAAESDNSCSDASFMDSAADGGRVGDESAEGESTSMSLDSADMTMDSPVSVVLSSSSTSSSTSQLNEALRLAAAQAGTKGIEYDENGDLSMEIASDQVTAAFQSWAGRRAGADALQDLTAFHDQENVGAVRQQRTNPGPGSSFQPLHEVDNRRETRVRVTVPTNMDVTMDMTRPVGRILPPQPKSGHSVDASALHLEDHRRSSIDRRQSSGEGSSLEDATMDFTVIVGGIEGEMDAHGEPEPAADFPAEQAAVRTIQLVKDDASQEIAVTEGEGRDPSQASLAIDEAEVSMEEILVEKMSLQEFLDLTSIQFMDLTTTKRRHTGKGVDEEERSDSQTKQTANTLEGRLRDACCVLPMLELHQHSCRELKKYISEGRKIIRQIEADTYTENPSLFREYMISPPDVQLLMDNQFRNMKTHARLSSKALWYDWRRTLLDDLKTGLLKMADGMRADDRTLCQYEDLLSSVLPALRQDHELLSAEDARLREQTEEIASADQIQLTTARNELLELDAEIEQKKALLASVQSQIRSQHEAIEAATEKKMTLAEDISQAEKIRQECQGWSASEVSKWKGLVDEIERKHGWAIVGIDGSAIRMTYGRQLQLVLQMSDCDSPGSASVPAEVSLCSSTEEAPFQHDRLKPSLSIKNLFIHAINEHLRLPTCITLRPVETLTLISALWREATSISYEVHALNRHHLLDVLIVSEETAASIKIPLLLPTLKTKIAITFAINISIQDPQTDPAITVAPRASVVYGNRFDEEKMGNFLASVLQRRATAAMQKSHARSGRWLEAVRALGNALLAQGQKGKPESG